MRTISAQALTTLTTEKGIEPILVVEIAWTAGIIKFYADKTVPQTPVLGKILELSTLENVVSFDKSGNSQSVNITLSDTDNSIKNIYNGKDIHKRPVKIYQWFTNIPFADKFVIFEGVISSPIVWKESDRTFSFDIISQLEDKEIGFSPEEGAFESIPDELIGRAWPLPFGRCLKIPIIKLDPIPTGATFDSNGVTDFSIQQQIAEVGQKAQQFTNLALLYFAYAIQAYHSSNRVDGPEETDEHFVQLGDQFTDQGNQYLNQAYEAQWDMAELIRTLTAQEGFAKSELRVHNGECFPQSIPLEIRVKGVLHKGHMENGIFHVDEVVHPDQEGEAQETAVTSIPVTIARPVGSSDAFQKTIQKADFIWIPPAQAVRMQTALPVRYIVSMIPCTVLNVHAYRDYNGARILSPVPREYYTVSDKNFGGITATLVTVHTALSYKDEGWDDELYVDVQSSIGSNTVAILKHLIDTYTTLTWDAASFNAANTKVTGFPSHFCLFERKNIVTALQEIAYQARCAIWLKDGKFYLRYLPVEPASVDTIVDSDIIHGSLELHHTSTEDLITKYVVSYKTNYSQDRPFKIILRNNVKKYGTQEEQEDWYIYNHPKMVDLAATFWLIRKSNTWKILRFKTPLHKLRLETFDPITINIQSGIASNGPVTGIIESVQLDSDDLSLEFEVWLPVRLGEMTKYNFAWPIDSRVRLYPENFDLPGSDGPGEDADGDLGPANGACNVGGTSVERGERRRIHDGHENPGQSEEDSTAQLVNDFTGLDTTQQPNFDYTYRNYGAGLTPGAFDSRPKTVPGKIVSGEGPEYRVDVFINGIMAKASRTKATNVDHKSTLSPGTWVMVTYVIPFQNDPKAPLQVFKYFLPTSSKPGCFPGKVVSGSGLTYVVTIYKNGIDNPGENVTARQLQFEITETIPAESWTLVAEGEKTDEEGQIVKEYTMQFPIWYE